MRFRDTCFTSAGILDLKASLFMVSLWLFVESRTSLKSVHDNLSSGSFEGTLWSSVVINLCLTCNWANLFSFLCRLHVMFHFVWRDKRLQHFLFLNLTFQLFLTWNSFSLQHVSFHLARCCKCFEKTVRSGIHMWRDWKCNNLRSLGYAGLQRQSHVAWLEKQSKEVKLQWLFIPDSNNVSGSCFVYNDYVMQKKVKTLWSFHALILCVLSYEFALVAVKSLSFGAFDIKYAFSSPTFTI